MSLFPYATTANVIFNPGLRSASMEQITPAGKLLAMVARLQMRFLVRRTSTFLLDQSRQGDASSGNIHRHRNHLGLKYSIPSMPARSRNFQLLKNCYITVSDTTLFPRHLKLM